MVLESTTIMPSVSDGSTPWGPKRTISTAAVSETPSRRLQRPRGFGRELRRVRAFYLLAGGTIPDRDFVSGLTRFVAIGWPMIPKPRNATRIGELLKL